MSLTRLLPACLRSAILLFLCIQAGGCTLLLPTVAGTQRGQKDLGVHELDQLREGTPVVVVRKNGETLQGGFRRVKLAETGAPESVVLWIRSRDVEVLVREVASISAIRGKPNVTRALVAGLFIDAIVILLITSSEPGVSPFGPGY